MFELIIASICFSLSFGIIKTQLYSISPDIIAELRLLIAALIFLPFFKPVGLKKIVMVCVIGIIQFGIMYILFLRAFEYLQAYEVVLLTTTTPVFVTLCSVILGERFKWSYVFCIVLSVLGSIIVIWQNISLNFILKGVLLMLLSNFCFALGQVLWKKYIKDNDIKIISMGYLAAALFVLPLALKSTNFSNFSLSYNQMLAILYLGLIPTGIGFWLWNKGTKKISSTMLAIMNNIKIPLGVFFALTLFGEKVNAVNFIAGCLIIFISIILYNKIKTTK